MLLPHECALNHATCRRLKDTLASSYHDGRFIAISAGPVILDGASLDSVRTRLSAMAKDPADVLSVQAGAGIEYPESIVIFTGAANGAETPAIHAPL
jgi:hypothetical protein